MTLFHFTTSLARRQVQRSENDGLMRVVVVTRLTARKIVISAALIHFVGENGPTQEDPDPISATT